jgi:hypothetical protein
MLTPAALSSFLFFIGDQFRRDDAFCHAPSPNTDHPWRIDQQIGSSAATATRAVRLAQG